MSENKCSICNEKFEDKYFDETQNKCILHCEKDGWYDSYSKLKDEYIYLNSNFIEYLGKLLEYNLN